MPTTSSTILLCLCALMVGCPTASQEAPAAETGAKAPAQVATPAAAAPAATPEATPAATPTAPPAATPETTPAATPAATPEATPSKAPPVFNPAAPPDGYSRCQGGECHTSDGRILTYKQVMAEIGATRMAGGLDTSRLPPAPEDVAAVPASATRTESGLAYRVLKVGTGARHPTDTSTVTVHYSGWTTDGQGVDSSVARGRPSGFPLTRVIPGWREALTMMVEGEKRRVWIPESLAYKGAKGAPAGMLVFDLELLTILAR